MDAAAYEALFESSPLPMHVSDHETQKILLVNQAACELYGWSREELLSMTLRDIRPPDEVPVFEQIYADTSKRKQKQYARSARHRTKDGRILDVRLQIAPVMLEGRHASVVVITDLTGTAEAERRFRLLVEHSSDGIALVKANNIVEYVSPGGQRILGYDPSEVLGVSAENRTHPDDLHSWQMPKPGDTRYHTARLRHRDGTWRWIESTTTNLLHDPAVGALVTNYRDITERKIAADALVESQRRSEFLLSATSAVTYTARVSGDYGATFVSANVADVLGYEASEFSAVSSFWLQNIHPADRQAVEAKLPELMAKDGVTLQYRFLHRDGTYRWMRDVARVIRNSAGEPLEVVGYWVDVSDQVRVEQALRRSEENFRTLIERTPTAMLVQRGGLHVYANPAAVAMFGYATASELIGTDIFDSIHPDDRETVRSRMEQVRLTGSTPPAVLRLLRADGSVFLFEAQAVWVDFDGQLSTVVMGWDVTERDEMFARVALADRMLSVGTLAVGVAHEINNPLSYVAANLETLEQELPNIQLREGSKLQQGALDSLLADVRDGVTRMASIVRDLRSLSRADHESRGPVDVVGVLTTAIKMAHNEVRHRARVVTSYEDNLPPVDGDAVRLGQVFINLLLNAAQSMPAGKADQNEIRIRATLVREQGQVRIDLSDTGSGMARGVLRRIFDPFFTTKSGIGTGLGLSISHQIVRSMNGQITVESELGRGSTFSVSLPIAQVQRTEIEVTAAPAPRAVGRLLIIDDEAAVGRSLAVLLAPELEVVAETRAAQALERIASGEKFDAILCDLMMPEISGMQLYERLLTTAPSYEGRIIFITGGAFTPEARTFLANLKAPKLEKPFSESQLLHAIEALRS